MRQIRENIWYVTYSELGKPFEKGPVKVDGLGTIFLDIADVRYINQHRELGYEPAFFVSRSEAMNGWMVVVARQETSLVPPYVRP
ncbi:MAG TPA: hypothetical protein VGE01_02870 [Fimbriimonas sp.]